MPSQNKWDDVWMKVAESISELSKDPTTKVGACCVSADNRRISPGYNGMPVGLEETDELWERPNKYEYVVHAEVNAVLNSPFDTQGATVYVTLEPCHSCLGKLRNAGVARVVWRDVNPRHPNRHASEILIPLFDEVLQWQSSH
jgi:dCMP deaminase